MLQPEGRNNEPFKSNRGWSADWPENSHFLFDLLLTTVGNRGFSDQNYTGLFSDYLSLAE
ncbi:MAG: hypothetical protein WDO19_28100 [Bacteroidota bacterium]